MNKGDIVWMAANGDGPRNHPLLKGLNLPPLGNIGRPAPMLTKTLLFVGDASDAVMGQAGISGPLNCGPSIRLLERSSRSWICRSVQPADR